MGNKALRSRLSLLLKEKKVNCRLYTCSKRPAYRILSATYLRDMIAFLENVSIGDKLHDYGVNQVVAEDFNFVPITPRKKKKVKGKSVRYNGEVLYKVDQLAYESGSYGCGCGSYDCNVNKNLKTKEEIVSQFLLSLYSIWGPTYVAEKYFKLLDIGIDILTEDGFLVDNYRELIESTNQ